MALLDFIDQVLSQSFGREAVDPALAPGRGQVHRSAVVIIRDVPAERVEAEIAAPDNGRLPVTE